MIWKNPFFNLMAPIDPKQLLAAFSPLLTSNGGIKNATEVPRLSSLMKKFSRKLVSRCVYCNVLLSTSPDVLEEFLRSGGWETIHLWIKSARELANKPFLHELLKLLLILPMNVERLRENDSPKIINKLSKSDDIELAQKAKTIVDKWTKMIELAAGKEVKDHHNHKDKDKDKKKRKKDSMDSTNSDSKDSSDSKKFKNLKHETNSLDSNDSNISFDSVIKEDNKVLIERTPRPSTAKVKPGKSRLDALVNSTPKLTKSRKESNIQSMNNKKLSNNVKSLTIGMMKPLNTSPNELQISNSLVTSTSSLSSIAKKSPVDVKPILTQPTTPNTTSTIASKHVLQDSTSFMEALIAPPTLAKKKRRGSGATLGKDNVSSSEAPSSSSPKASPPKFSFYKDMIDEKVDQQIIDSDNNSNDDNEESSSNDNVISIDGNNANETEEQNDEPNQEELNHMNVDITVADIKDNSSLPKPSFSSSFVSQDKSSSNKVKPILSYIKKGTKKSVRWVEDSKLNQVKYFELDETERVNVNRPAGSSGSFCDIRRFDMKHEAEFMLMARRCANNMDVADDYQSRAQTYFPWKLITCDSHSNLVENGKESKERFVQAERMKTTLESFYIRSQIPDSPQEPEIELNIESSDNSKIIPLEDDNNPNNVHDFSNIDLPQPKTGEQLPSRLPDFKSSPTPINNFNRIVGNIPPYPPTGGQPLLPGGPSLMPPFGGPLMPPPDPYSVRPTNVPQFYPPNGGPPMQQWSESGPPHPPPHFVPPFPNQIPQGRGGPMGGRPPRLPRNAQNTVCRHFARTGKCRFQPRCNFLHSNDKL